MSQKIIPFLIINVLKIKNLKLFSFLFKLKNLG